MTRRCSVYSREKRPPAVSLAGRLRRKEKDRTLLWEISSTRRGGGGGGHATRHVNYYLVPDEDSHTAVTHISHAHKNHPRSQTDILTCFQRSLLFTALAQPLTGFSHSPLKSTAIHTHTHTHKYLTHCRVHRQPRSSEFVCACVRACVSACVCVSAMTLTKYRNIYIIAQVGYMSCFHLRQYP